MKTSEAVAMLNARPTTIVFGAERSSTTSLHNALGQHPDIFSSPAKELNYFLRCSHGRMPCWASPQVRAATPVAHDAYAEVWRAGTGHKVRLESSPMYLRDPSAAERIVSANLRIDLIALLRHPVEQAWSLYRTLKDGPTIESFEAALESSELVTHSPFKLNEYGLYHRHLAPWYEASEHYRNVIDRCHGRPEGARIKVILFDDLINHTDATLADLFEFLGVPPHPVQFRRLNPAGQAWLLPLKRMLDGSSTFKRLARKWLPEMAVRRLTSAHHRVRGANLREAPALPAALRAELTEKFYRDDIEALERLIGRDLSRWLVVPKLKVKWVQNRVGAVA